MGPERSVAVTPSELIKSGLVPPEKQEQLERYFEARRRFNEIFGNSLVGEIDTDRAVDIFAEARQRFEEELQTVERVMEDIRVLTEKDVRVASQVVDALGACRQAFRGIDPGEIRERFRRARGERDELLKLLQRIRADLNAAGLA
jgi:hypothetical protein